MPNTTRLALPYPDGTLLLAEIDLAIKALAEAVDTNLGAATAATTVPTAAGVSSGTITARRTGALVVLDVNVTFAASLAVNTTLVIGTIPSASGLRPASLQRVMMPLGAGGGAFGTLDVATDGTLSVWNDRAGVARASATGVVPYFLA